MTWQDKLSVKKGNLGEAILDDYLVKRGFIPYAPTTGGAHPFDRLCASKDKRKICIAEAKTKPHRKYYPDTGIDYSCFQGYQHIQEKHNIDILLVFVDEIERLIYGNLLRELTQPRTIKHLLKTIEYPLVQNRIIYFPLVAMKTLATITDAHADQLIALSDRSYEYMGAQN